MNEEMCKDSEPKRPELDERLDSLSDLVAFVDDRLAVFNGALNRLDHTVDNSPPSEPKGDSPGSLLGRFDSLLDRLAVVKDKSSYLADCLNRLI